MAPIHNAVRSGKLNGISALLNSGANIESRNNKMTPLLIAAYNGYLAIVRLLLERGANINARDRDEMTPLIWAVYNGYLAVVKLLLDRGANIEAQDNHGMTALLWAVHKGRLEFVKLLLERGAKIGRLLSQKRNMSANIRNAIIKHKAGLTIAKYKKTSNMRRRAASAKALNNVRTPNGRPLPPNAIRSIMSMLKPRSPQKMRV